MLQALWYCHVRCIIHQDIKPQKLLVSVNRKIVKLADFGLARFTVALTNVVVSTRLETPLRHLSD